MSEIIEDTVQEVKSKTPTKAANKFNAKFAHSSANTFSKDQHADPLDMSSVKESQTAEMESVNHTINVMSLGPGNLLKVTREEAKLSKEDVAQELRLTVRHIDYLEQDAYHKFPAVAFYIGYLRNYSKFLALDPNKMIAKFHAVYKAAPESPVYKKITATNSTNILRNLNEHWPLNFFTKDKSKSHVSTNTIKYMLLALSVITIVSVLWWLVSTVNVADDKVVTSNVMQLAPEVVDNLLPTSPVIVQNTIEQPSTSNETQMLSQNNTDKQLDTQDELRDIS